MLFTFLPIFPCHVGFEVLSAVTVKFFFTVTAYSLRKPDISLEHVSIFRIKQ
jgi:hypothetical protein